MKKISYLLLLLVCLSAIPSCHAPEVNERYPYNVYIYPNNLYFKMGQKCTIYSVITPKSECENYLQFHWVLNSRIQNYSCATTTVDKVREALGAEYTIPDDSYCQFCTFTAPNGVGNYNVSFTTGSSYCPSVTKYIYTSK